MALVAHQCLLGQVTVYCGPKPNDWAYRSLRPIEYIQPDANVVAVKPSQPAQVIPLAQQPLHATSLTGQS